jgi:hypothetical protein
MGADQIHEIKQYATRPDLAVEFDEGGTLIDWSTEGVSAVLFQAAFIGSETLVINAAASTSAQGVLVYQFASGDTDTKGRLVGNFKVTYTGGKVAYFPPNDDLIVKVT